LATKAFPLILKVKTPTITGWRFCFRFLKVRVPV